LIAIKRCSSFPVETNVYAYQVTHVAEKVAFLAEVRGVLWCHRKTLTFITTVTTLAQLSTFRRKVMKISVAFVFGV